MSTVIIFIILIAIVAGVLYNMYQDNKSGKGMCGGNCSNCSANCKSKEKQE